MRCWGNRGIAALDRHADRVAPVLDDADKIVMSVSARDIPPLVPFAVAAMAFARLLTLPPAEPRAPAANCRPSVDATTPGTLISALRSSQITPLPRRGLT